MKKIGVVTRLNFIALFNLTFLLLITILATILFLSFQKKYATVINLSEQQRVIEKIDRDVTRIDGAALKLLVDNSEEGITTILAAGDGLSSVWTHFKQVISKHRNSVDLSFAQEYEPVVDTIRVSIIEFTQLVKAQQLEQAHKYYNNVLGRWIARITTFTNHSIYLKELEVERLQQAIENYKKRALIVAGGILTFVIMINVYVNRRNNNAIKHIILDLDSSKKYTEKIIGSLSEMLFIFNSDGEITEVNNTALNSLGYQKNEVVGKKIGDMLAEDALTENPILQDPTKLKSEILKDSVREVNAYCLSKAGEKIPVLMSGSLLEGATKHTESIILSVRDARDSRLVAELEDITKNLQKRVDAQTEDLIYAKNEAEKANRLKSEFLSNMSHELRTPMHFIMGFSKRGANRAAQSSVEETVERFQSINNSSTRLLALVNDILDLSKLESGIATLEFANGDLQELALNTVKSLSMLSEEKKLTLSIESSIDDKQAMVDAEKIEQVFINLLSNAIKFSPEKSAIVINIQETTLAVGRRASDMETTPALSVSVIDCGVGIPSDELDTIFDKFVQSSKTKTGAGGTGLGLAICTEIIRGHRGKLWAKNNANGAGATFNFTIPRRQHET